MKIYNIEEHFSCYCYDNSELPLVEVLNIERGEIREFVFSSNEIIFILKGKMDFNLYKNPGGEIQKGQFAFMPAGDQLNCKALADSKLLVLRLNNGTHLCHNYGIEQLYKEVKGVKKPKRLYTLEINKRLQHFVEGLVEMYEDGLKCRYFFMAELTRALTIIRSYYTKQALCSFFFPILSPNTAFSEYVRTNHFKYRTVTELATSMNMRPQQFSRRFNEIFKQPPYEWMQQERARLIYSEICISNRPFKDIATSFGFSIQANFIRFCRTFFGATPNEIRKKDREKRENEFKTKQDVF